MSSEKKRALGRGLDALLPTVSTISSSSGASYGDRSVFTCPIETLHPQQGQPRQRMDGSKLDELAASLKEHGLIEPLVVRRSPSSPIDSKSSRASDDGGRRNAQGSRNCSSSSKTCPQTRLSNWRSSRTFSARTWIPSRSPKPSSGSSKNTVTRTKPSPVAFIRIEQPSRTRYVCSSSPPVSERWSSKASCPKATLALFWEPWMMRRSNRWRTKPYAAA